MSPGTPLRVTTTGALPSPDEDAPFGMLQVSLQDWESAWRLRGAQKLTTSVNVLGTAFALCNGQHPLNN